MLKQNPGRLRRQTLALLAVCWLVCFAALFLFTRPAYARAPLQQPTPPAEPGQAARNTRLTIDVTLYEWWMSRYDSNEVVCQIVVDHAGLPTTGEVYTSCGASIQEDWLDTPPCNGESCQGVYLALVGEKQGQRVVPVSLPPAKAWISVTNCTPEPPDNRCTTPPVILLSGEEPLPNESIINVQGQINGIPFSCPGSQCALALPPTGSQGVMLEFWAESSFGDATPHYNALVRIVPWGDFMAPEGSRSDPSLWFVDVLSEQWRGDHPASCADTWRALPPVGGPPAWLATPKEASELQSSVSFYYLAGMLIQNGVVDASACPGGGLAQPQLANACGVQTALPDMVAWQNNFDNEIIRAAKDTGIPARLMKNIFSRESQLWPGIFTTLHEAGLGQMSEKGADTLLLWNQSFFEQFCPLMLGRDTCDLGWYGMGEDERNILRGALVSKVNASCTDCPQGIDLTRAQFSVRVFAQTLLANCEQTGHILQADTQRMPGEVASYEDLWKFTLVNYNAGSGCLQNAVRRTLTQGQSLTWPNLSANLEPGCSSAVAYINDISRLYGLEPTPTATPWLVFATAPAPTAQVTPGPSGAELYPVIPVPEIPLQPLVQETPAP